MPGVGSSKRREVVTPLAKLRGAILRFGQNTVRTPGRTHDNHCVTKGLKFRAALFKGRQVQGGALVALRRGRNTFRIFPEGAFFFAYFLFELELSSEVQQKGEVDFKGSSKGQRFSGAEV